MTNAKLEFLTHTTNLKVIAAKIKFGHYYDDDYDDYDDNENNSQNTFLLKPGYSEKRYSEFLNFLDRDYNSGYGGQELFGIVCCEDGYWLERGEYDGSEWWDVKKYPSLLDLFDESDVIKYERMKKLKNIQNSSSSL